VSQPDQDPSLARDVALAFRALSDVGEQLRQACASACGLHPTDYRALNLIVRAHEQGDVVTAGDMAARLDLSSGAVTYLVERLTAAGHVERSSDPQDRRKVLLLPTASGIQLTTTCIDGNLGAVIEALQPLDEAETRAGLKTMQALVDTLGRRTDQVRSTDLCDAC